MKYYYLVSSITNLSNLSWLTFNKSHVEDEEQILDIDKKTFDLDFPLHNTFIDILLILKELYCAPNHVHCMEIEFIDQWIAMLKQIIELNKKICMDNMENKPENDLHKICKFIMDDNKRLTDENEELKDQIMKLKSERYLKLQCDV